MDELAWAGLIIGGCRFERKQFLGVRWLEAHRSTAGDIFYASSAYPLDSLFTFHNQRSIVGNKKQEIPLTQFQIVRLSIRRASDFGQVMPSAGTPTSQTSPSREDLEINTHAAVIAVAKHRSFDHQL